MLSQVSSKTTKKSSKESVKGSTIPDSPKQIANSDTTMALNIVSTSPDSDLANAANATNAVYAEKKDPTGTSTEDVVTGISPDGFDEAATKKLIRKLDLHLIPFMALIYL